MQQLHPLCLFSRRDSVLTVSAILLSDSPSGTNMENLQRRVVKVAVLAGTQQKNQKNHNQKHGAATNEQTHPCRSGDPINV